MATKGKARKARAKIKTLATKREKSAAVKGGAGNIYTAEVDTGRRVQK